MKYTVICIFILLLATHIFALGSKSKKQCTVQEAIQAEEQASSLKSWEEVNAAYRKFSHCDDGAIGEGYSDSISSLLSEEWSKVFHLNRLTVQDKTFEKFILRHIDELMSPDQADKIRKNTKTNCPPNAESLCKAILFRIREVDKAIGTNP